MKCFDHMDKDAVGTCKNCCRGLCKDCLSVVDRSLACKGECVESVKMLDQLLMRSKNSVSVTRSAYMRNAAFYYAMALVFAGIGIYQESTFSRLFFFPTAFIFFVGGIYQQKTASEIVKK